jgi:hypothetical protein
MKARRILRAGLCVAALTGAVEAQAAITDGWTRYTSTYTVQNRTNASLGDRFTYSGGIWTTTVFAGEERVEMRWQNWPVQTRDNLWSGDINFDSQTQRTCIMQIKSNTGGEPIYLQVSTPGTLRNDNDGTSLATGMANQWFNWKASFNPSTGVSRGWINDTLVKTRQYNTSARDWYWKNGTYNNGLPSGGRSRAQFRNIQLWRNDGGGGSATPTPAPTATPSTGPTPTPAPTSTPGPTATPGGTLSGYYRITPRHSGKAVAVQSASTANSANVFQWSYGGSNTNDEWQALSIGGGHYRLIARHSGKDMVVQSASTAEGGNIIQYTYGGATTNDEWAIVDVGSGYFRITNRHSGKSAEVVGAGTADGADVVQRTYSGGTHQQFEFVSVP